MSKKDHDQFGDITIQDTGYGFRVIPDNSQDDSGCGGGCSGCGQ